MVPRAWDHARRVAKARPEAVRGQPSSPETLGTGRRISNSLKTVAVGPKMSSKSSCGAGTPAGRCGVLLRSGSRHLRPRFNQPSGGPIHRGDDTVRASQVPRTDVEMKYPRPTGRGEFDPQALSCRSATYRGPSQWQIRKIVRAALKNTPPCSKRCFPRRFSPNKDWPFAKALEIHPQQP